VPDVLLGQAYFLRFDPKLWRAMQPFAPLGMIADARARGCAVAVSGSDATDHPEIYLNAGAAAVIVGEGEVTLEELVRALESGGSPADVRGIACLAGDCVYRTQPRPFVQALDDLPRPAWPLVNVDLYRHIWRRRHGYHAMNLATTRGCPFHCNWCAKPIYGQRYAVRAAQNVAAEMAWLKHDYAPDQLAIVDDVFGLRPGWVEAFAREVEAQNARIPFRCLMRADQIDADVVRALAAAGCRMVWMGAESGSQKILDAMEKGVRVEQIRDAARQLQTAGIQVGMFLQFGYPGETWSDVEKTLDLVRAASPDDIGVSVSYPLPGTKFHERVRAELGAKQNWVDSDDLAMMYRATYPPQFYRVLHHVVHHEFRTRQLARRVRHAAARPLAMRTPDLRRVAAWIYHRTALPIASYELRRLARS
jgi:anaerobic magnesium-protoporphyrin IX monomethyl ester cyclase